MADKKPELNTTQKTESKEAAAGAASLGGSQEPSAPRRLGRLAGRSIVARGKKTAATVAPSGTAGGAGANKDKLSQKEIKIIINLAELAAEVYTKLGTKLKGIEISENKRLFLKLFGHFFFGILDEIPGVNEVSSLIATIIDLSYDLSEIKTSLHIDSQTFHDVEEIFTDFIEKGENILHALHAQDLKAPPSPTTEGPHSSPSSLETHNQHSGSVKLGGGKKKQTKKNKKKKTKRKKRKKKTKAKN